MIYPRFPLSDLNHSRKSDSVPSPRIARKKKKTRFRLAGRVASRPIWGIHIEKIETPRKACDRASDPEPSRKKIPLEGVPLNENKALKSPPPLP